MASHGVKRNCGSKKDREGRVKLSCAWAHITSYSSPFSTATLTGNQAQCPHCGKMTGCNKENFVARFEDGGFVGNDAI